MPTEENTDVTEKQQPPACPVCSRQMVFSDPAHEKAYWTCPNLHEPVGIVQLPREVDYAFAVALTSICDHFDSAGLEPFTDIDSADEVSGLVTSLMLERYQKCVEFKRMRQRKDHDDKPSGSSDQDDSSEQATLKAMTDGGQVEDGTDREAELDPVRVFDSHGNPYWNSVAKSGGNAPGTGNLHRARIENGRVVEIECHQHAENWVPFTADSTPQRDRRTCSRCGQLWRVPGVERADHWSWVNITDVYAPADWSPKPATDGGTDHHADEDATIDEERVKVEESGVGIDIIRERYCMVKYDSGERWYDWHRDESFHVRADNIGQLTEEIQSCDTERLLDSLRKMQRVEQSLSTDTAESGGSP